MSARDEAMQPEAIVCAPARRRNIYRAAAARLQRIASAYPEVRFDADTPAISLATNKLNEALASFIEGTCGREAVSRAFDCYEQALIEAGVLAESDSREAVCQA